MEKKLLFDSFERNVIKKYNGKWGFQMPNYAPSIIIRYNFLNIQKEITKVFRINKAINCMLSILTKK